MYRKREQTDNRGETTVRSLFLLLIMLLIQLVCMAFQAPYFFICNIGDLLVLFAWFVCKMCPYAGCDRVCSPLFPDLEMSCDRLFALGERS
ncbi:MULTISPECIES: hypothetical protein [Spirulina sp. CCY15215]|uniref:hypothetical protein n=1 Tax=Spirulina sp. CCY15215 TaxID=2767591 RepID=UPI00195214BC|nr:hypothetical protein [Spirulina major]